MRNAQQELNLHVNALQSELDELKRRIDAMLASKPGADGARSMDWPTPSLPSPVISALLEGYRDVGHDLRMEARGRGLRLAAYRDLAAPLPVIA